jgi:hypothetical protein
MRFESPPYTAVIEFAPPFKIGVVKVAKPLLSIPVPGRVLLFMNETVSPSSGAPSLDGATAVKVTACP